MELTPKCMGRTPSSPLAKPKEPTFSKLFVGSTQCHDWKKLGHVSQSVCFASSRNIMNSQSFPFCGSLIIDEDLLPKTPKTPKLETLESAMSMESWQNSFAVCMSACSILISSMLSRTHVGRIFLMNPVKDVCCGPTVGLPNLGAKCCFWRFVAEDLQEPEAGIKTRGVRRKSYGCWPPSETMASFG